MNHFLPCALMLLLASALHGAATTPSEFRGGKFEWARLKTNNPYWDQHAERDPHVIRMMRQQSSLNIADSWQSADVGNLKDLCLYPFVFAETISSLSDTESSTLAEYLRRGGFLLIDACVRVTVNPNADDFLAAQIRTLSRQFPELSVKKLDPDHAVFSIYFQMSKGLPQTRSGTNPTWAHASTEPLRGIFVGDRMVGVISLSGFQCGWVGLGPTSNDAVRMVTNIYIYAMTH